MRGRVLQLFQERLKFYPLRWGQLYVRGTVVIIVVKLEFHAITLFSASVQFALQTEMFSLCRQRTAILLRKTARTNVIPALRLYWLATVPVRKPH